MKSKQRALLERIAAQLSLVRLLEDADIGEIQDELQKTADCVVVRRSQFKEANEFLVLSDGKIGVYIESVRGDHPIKITPEKFVRRSCQVAKDSGSTARFIIEARKLAQLLISAANRLEKNPA